MIAFSARIVALHSTARCDSDKLPQTTRTRRGRGGRGRRSHPLDDQLKPLPDEFALVSVAAVAVDRAGGTRWHTATTFAPSQVSELQAAAAAASAANGSSGESDASPCRPNFADGADLASGGVPAGMHDRCIPTAAVTEWAGARVAELMRNALSSASGSFQADACGWSAESSPTTPPPSSTTTSSDVADRHHQQQQLADALYPHPVATVVYPRCLVDAPSLEAIIHISVDTSSGHTHRQQQAAVATTAPMIAFVDTDELFFADDAAQAEMPPLGFNVLDVAHAAAIATRGDGAGPRATRANFAKRDARHARLPPAQLDEARHWRPRLTSRELSLLLPVVLGQPGLGSSVDSAAEALASVEHGAVADAKVLHWILRLITLPDGALVDVPAARNAAAVSCDPLHRFDVVAARRIAATGLTLLLRQARDAATSHETPESR